jgi:hypothetical protein
MITNLDLGQDGRLGNQLFQYAAVRTLGDVRDYEVKIPDPKTMEWQGQKCLLDQFNITASYLTGEDKKAILYHYKEEDYMNYNPNFFSLPDNLTISGYFQSTFYFWDALDLVVKELTPKQEYIDEAKKYLDSIREGKAIVSVHLRRGDNTDKSNPSVLLNNMYDPGGAYFAYLKEALSLCKDCTFIVFSGGARGAEDNEDDIAWCKENLGIEAHYSENASPMQDFSRIMLCDKSVLSPVSSFGWWSAFVGQHLVEDKIVYAPLHYHPDRPDYTHREGFYPSSFTVL